MIRVYFLIFALFVFLSAQLSAHMPVNAELHLLSVRSQIKIEKRNIHFYLFCAVRAQNMLCLPSGIRCAFTFSEWNLITARGRTLTHVHVCLSISWLLIAQTNDFGDFRRYHSRSTLELTTTQTKVILSFVFLIIHGTKVLMMFYCLHCSSNSWINKNFRGLLFALDMTRFGTKAEWKIKFASKMELDSRTRVAVNYFGPLHLGALTCVRATLS